MKKKYKIAEIEDISRERIKEMQDNILENYEKAAYMTAAKLGAAAGVSESTVVRCASVKRYAGYAYCNG